MTMVDPMKPVGKRARTPKHVAKTARTALSQVIEPVPHLELQKPKSRFAHPGFKIAALMVMVLTLIVAPEIVGQIVIILYALLAILRRFSLHLTFALAVVLLGISPVVTLLMGGEGSGATIAGYSFAFLGVGLVQMILGYRRGSGPSGLKRE